MQCVQRGFCSVQSNLSLLYNRGKTDGLTHTCQALVPEVLGFDSHRFAGGKLYWVVNHDYDLVAVQ